MCIMKKFLFVQFPNILMPLQGVEFFDEKLNSLCMTWLVDHGEYLHNELVGATRPHLATLVCIVHTAATTNTCIFVSLNLNVPVYSSSL